MSGHSKWATTKHQKAIKDSRRAKSFAKLIKNIEVAAKIGGADMSGNPTLVDAVQKAKKTSVPNDNIDRAIKRGAGLTGEVIDDRDRATVDAGPLADDLGGDAELGHARWQHGRLGPEGSHLDPVAEPAHQRPGQNDVAPLRERRAGRRSPRPAPAPA